MKKDDKFTVTLMRDTIISYPELWMTVFINDNVNEASTFSEMLARAKCKITKSIRDADVVIFTGGVDINPALYGEQTHGKVYFQERRDDDDIAAFNLAYAEGIPMFGVCRGAQFLHVANGGKLYQHVDNHNSLHDIYDIVDRQKIERVSSVHHQMVRPNAKNGMKILATTNKSRLRYFNDTDSEQGANADIEAFFYQDSCCLGVQGHPEYRGYNSFTKWCLNLMKKYIIENPDITIKDRTCYRLKEDVRAARKALKPLEKLPIENKLLV